MKIGDIIRNQLKSRQVSILDLEKRTGLTNADIKNLLYNRSKNIKKLEAIAKALNVSLTTLMPAMLLSPFDHKIYALSVKIVCNNFDSLLLSTSKEVCDEYVAHMYNYIVTDRNKTEKEFLLYCEGMLTNAINMGRFDINTN